MAYFREPDFDEAISHEPIYYWQFVTLRRLCPDMPVAKIRSFSSTEAITFINAIRSTHQRNDYQRLNQKWNKVQEGALSSTVDQNSVVTIEVLHVRKVSAKKQNSINKV